MDKKIIDIIENAFENIENINSNSDGDIISAINETINNLDQGNIRVAEKVNDKDASGEFQSVVIMKKKSPCPAG